MDNFVSIAPLLKLLSKHPASTPPSLEILSDVAAAFALVFENNISPVQTSALLTALTFTGLHHDTRIIAAVSKVMRDAAIKVTFHENPELVAKRKLLKKNNYHGGFIDIVGTGGDGHNTFNVSTTSALLVSPHLLVCKHGNRAATSTSGAADLLNALAKPTDILALQPESIPALIGTHSNFAFLFATTYHPGMRHVAHIRRELGFPTLFNILGPLANPVEGIEARILGVGKKALGPVFIEVLRLMGCHKGMVVCGQVGEGLDEISPCGTTSCWRLVPPPPGTKGVNDEPPLATVEEFELHPTKDFGVQTHPLEECKSQTPAENAAKVMSILNGEVADGDSVLDYCLINAAAMIVVAGVVDTWKEGVDLVRQGMKDGRAAQQLKSYIEGSKILLAGIKTS